MNAADIKKMGWTLGKELGSGHFAKVKLVTRDSDGTTAALKIIKKPKGAPPPQQRTWPSAEMMRLTDEKSAEKGASCPLLQRSA